MKPLIFLPVPCIHVSDLYYCSAHPIQVHLRLHICVNCVLAVPGAVRLRNGASKLLYQDMDMHILLKILPYIRFSSGTYACVLRCTLAHASLHSARVPSSFVTHHILTRFIHYFQKSITFIFQYLSLLIFRETLRCFTFLHLSGEKKP